MTFLFFPRYFLHNRCNVLFRNLEIQCLILVKQTHLTPSTVETWLQLKYQLFISLNAFVCSDIFAYSFNILYRCWLIYLHVIRPISVFCLLMCFVLGYLEAHCHFLDCLNSFKVFFIHYCHHLWIIDSYCNRISSTFQFSIWILILFSIWIMMSALYGWVAGFCDITSYEWRLNNNHVASTNCSSRGYFHWLCDWILNYLLNTLVVKLNLSNVFVEIPWRW